MDPILTTLVVGCLAAAASPGIVLLSRARYAPAHVAGARRMLLVSALVATVFVCHVAGVSFAFRAPNVIVEVFAMLLVLGLVVFSFILRPRAVGILTGLYALVAWLLLVLFTALGALFEGGSGREVTMKDGSVCRITAYGFVASDSGVDIGIFRRYLFVDIRIASHRYSAIYPDADHLTYPDQAIQKQCLADPNQK